jgi:hypothetical protein
MLFVSVAVIAWCCDVLEPYASPKCDVLSLQLHLQLAIATVQVSSQTMHTILSPYTYMQFGTTLKLSPEDPK